MHQAMTTYRVVEVKLHSFVTLVRDNGEWLVLRCGRFNPVERTLDPNCIGGWAGPRADLGTENKKKLPCGNRTPVVQSIVTELTQLPRFLAFSAEFQTFYLFI
jgi:hypothetical protein